MKNCGLKNSFECPESEPVVVNPAFPFRFVDGIDGLWSTLQSSQYESVLNCPLNTTVVFQFPKGTHDIVKLPSLMHYESCSVSGYDVLSPSTYDEVLTSISEDSIDMNTMLMDMPYVTYYHKCEGELFSIDYISCSIPGHCLAGQKIAIRTTAPPTNDSDGSELEMHVDSLQNLLTLLGARNDPLTGFLIMDRGYQTEELATQTVDWIWCGIDHCPRMAMDVWEDATIQDCHSILFLLLGFVNRKRPVPQFEEAEKYYRFAIYGNETSENTTSFPEIDEQTTEFVPLTSRNECAARSYLSKLFIDKEDYEMAMIEAQHLCTRCQFAGDDARMAMRQAKSEFDLISNSTGIQWPESEECLNFLNQPNSSGGQNLSSPGMNTFYALLMIYQIAMFFI